MRFGSERRFRGSFEDGGQAAMKKKYSIVFTVVLLCAAALIALSIGTGYFNFISQQIYADSTGNLEELYTQVNRSFAAFVQRNWGLLESWGDYLTLAGDAPAAEEYLRGERDYWGFSQLYFLAADGSGVTLDGEPAQMDLGAEWQRLFTDGEPLMAGQALPDGQEITVFAAAVSGVYRGTAYEALAVSYTNADMVSSLNVDAFSGNAKCFVVHGNGDVLLSTQPGGSIFGNFLRYLRAASDLSEEALAAIQADWTQGTPGLVRCRIGGQEQCLLYQSVGYQDYMLLSAVPLSMVSAGFLSVQRTTMYVLIAIFLLIGTALGIVLFLRGRDESRENRAQLQYRDRMFDVLSSTVDDIFLMLDGESHQVDYISPNVERLLGSPVEEARKDIRVMEKCAVDFNVVIPQEQLEAIPLHGSFAQECEYRHQTTGGRRWYRMTVYHFRSRASQSTSSSCPTAPRSSG